MRLALAAMLLVSACSLCSEELEAEQTSPGGHVALLGTRGCGATTRDVRIVKVDGKNVVAVDTHEPLRLEWHGERLSVIVPASVSSRSIVPVDAEGFKLLEFPGR